MSETLFYEGSTYYLEKIIGPLSGTGFVSTQLENLSSGSTYSILVAAYNNVGLSEIPPPVSLNIPSGENRPPITCICWAWYNPDLRNMTLYETGSTVNMIHASQDMRLSQVWRGSERFNIATGYTAPDGSTGAFAILGVGPSGGTSIYQELAIEHGNTYVYSFYHRVSGGATGFRVGAYYNATSAVPNATTVFGTQGITFRQFLPVTSSPSSSLPVVAYPTGLSGWQRFAFEFYASIPHRYQIFLTTWYNSTNRYPQYFWGHQLEKVTP